jgi:acetyl-CoA carboxylase carboxyltransferase component
MNNPKIEKMLKERDRLRMGGGEQAIASQHTSGKLTARERLELLYDPGTCRETAWSRG